jgi:hypothetical protein
METAGIEPTARRKQNPKQVVLLPANALISHRSVPPLRPVSSRLVPFNSPLEGHTGGTCGPTGAICLDASGLSSPNSQGSREPRGRRTGACALARCGRGGAGGGARVGVPAEAAGGDGAVRGGEGQPGHAAGGGERGGARPTPVRGAGRKPGTWSAECWRTASRGCAARVARTSNAKRAHVTAVHLVERVLPHVPYRQWTLSFPHRVRWVLLKDVGLLSDVLTLFLRAGARPAAAEGTAAGPTWWAGRGRVVHPVLRLRLAGDSYARACGRGKGF